MPGLPPRPGGIEDPFATLGNAYYRSESPVQSIRRRFLSVDYEEDGTPEGGITQKAEHAEPGPGHLNWWWHRLTDLCLITVLAFRLYFGYLYTGVRWFFKFSRLVAFSMLLLPGFSQMIAFYFFSPRLYRSVPYGTNPRNRLDIYLPRRKWRKAGKCSVVIYVTGGAWTIGYKAWGALFGRRLSQRGVLVFCLDYRNFPQGGAMDMLEDINTGIDWALNNLELYGGNPESVFLVGQSAGGHLTSLALLAQACQATAAAGNNNPGTIGSAPSWDVTKLKGYVGVSGAYDLVSLAPHLHRRGMYRKLFDSIMSGPSGDPMLEELSPALVAQRAVTPEVAALLPRMTLLHGTADKSVPIDNAEAYVSALITAGVRCTLKAYVGKTHTQPIIEDPMRGGRDELMDEVLSLIQGEKCVNVQFPMLPSLLIDTATLVCPF